MSYTIFMKQLLIAIIALLLALLVFSISPKKTVAPADLPAIKQGDITVVSSATSTMLLAGQEITIETVSTQPARQRGLSGRPSLPENSGLLFDMGTDGLHGIWMKDMNFPLDIIWFDPQFTVVHIEQNATPESYPEIFRPTVLSRYVLEVNAGYVAKNTIKVGDSATFK